MVGCPGRWWPGVGAGGRVDAHDGVEVDGAASLELGDFGEGHARVLRVLDGSVPARDREVIADLLGEAVPQRACAGVPEHGARVVVAVWAQRHTDHRIISSVPGGAVLAHPVLAGLCVASGMAPLAGRAVFSGAVYGPEGRRGQRGEHARVLAYLLGDAFAAEQPSDDQVVGVALV